MKATFFLVCSILAFSQAPDEAARLLRQVAESASSTSSWQVEGRIENSKPSSESDTFTLSIKVPAETRFEQTGTWGRSLIVCDGHFAWTYSSALDRYKKEPHPKNKLCSPIVGDWEKLPSILRAPALVGECGPTPSTQSAGFFFVRGLQTPELASSGEITRTLCIDKERRQVAWEKWENKYSTRIFTYSKLDRDLEIAQNTFVFAAPAGSTETEHDLPIPRAMGERGMSSGVGITAPKLISKKAPKYGKASQVAKLEGTTALYVVIGTDGIPSEILIYRKLSPDLDEEAIKSVRQWRFTAGNLKGEPIALPVIIEINFKLK